MPRIEKTELLFKLDRDSGYYKKPPRCNIPSSLQFIPSEFLILPGRSRTISGSEILTLVSKERTHRGYPVFKKGVQQIASTSHYLYLFKTRPTIDDLEHFTGVLFTFSNDFAAICVHYRGSLLVRTHSEAFSHFSQHIIKYYPRV